MMTKILESHLPHHKVETEQNHLPLRVEMEQMELIHLLPRVVMELIPLLPRAASRVLLLNSVPTCALPHYPKI